MSEAEEKSVIMPGLGEVITSLSSRNTFTVGTEIGEGAFGKVFNCRDSWDNSLAMKVFKPTGGSYEEVRAAAVSELGRLLTLRHPNITYVFDAFEYRSTFHIVTELCDFSLTQLFELENFDPTIWLMPIARCLLQAVDYLHRNGFAHQDIHPSNIFGAFPRDELGVDMAGSSRPIVFKLGDLGLSAAFGDMAPHSKRALWILPPECIDQASDGPIDHRQDLPCRPRFATARHWPAHALERCRAVGRRTSRTRPDLAPAAKYRHRKSIAAACPIPDRECNGDVARPPRSGVVGTTLSAAPQAR
ncbi:MAG: protein kinase [Dehalococcoidia bacterium]|nr:protein kinase [Dehalococcoidia bacterium]